MDLDSLKIEVPGPDDITEAEVIRHNFMMSQWPGYSGSAEHKRFMDRAEKQQKRSK